LNQPPRTKKETPTPKRRPARADTVASVAKYSGDRSSDNPAAVARSIKAEDDR
jgi:hypothetical protein